MKLILFSLLVILLSTQWTSAGLLPGPGIPGAKSRTEIEMLPLEGGKRPPLGTSAQSLSFNMRQGRTQAVLGAPKMGLGVDPSLPQVFKTPDTVREVLFPTKIPQTLKPFPLREYVQLLTTPSQHALLDHIHAILLAEPFRFSKDGQIAFFNQRLGERLERPKPGQTFIKVVQDTMRDVLAHQFRGTYGANEMALDGLMDKFKWLFPEGDRWVANSVMLLHQPNVRTFL